MPDFTVNTHMLAFALILLGAFVIIFVVWRNLDKRLANRGDTEWANAFHHQVATRPMPEWDGQGWPETTSVGEYLEDPWLASAQPSPNTVMPVPATLRYMRPQPQEVTSGWPVMAAGRPRPVVSVSAPMPVLDPEADTDLFIARMRENTDRWISYYSQAELAGV
jgi:hypothetical protein